MSIKEAQLYFDIECLLTPLMIYHNCIDYIKNTEDSSKKKLSTYKTVLESLCIHDTIQTNIFEAQEWDELYEIASIYGASIPNYYLTELKNQKPVQIQFTSLLNKISQMYVNKKLLNSAKFSIGKINYDSDEIIYLTEIISYYFDNYKTNVSDDKNFENNSNNKDDESDNECENECDKEDIKLESFVSNYKKPLKNNSELVTFMNNYKMSIDGLENIFKIEKINQLSDKKRKKKFTLKIKKEILNFLLITD